MVLIKNPLSGGGGGAGDVVNGIVQEYLANTSDVEAGTFVEFVSSLGAETTGYYSKMVALEDGKVFVMYRSGTSSNVYGTVVNIENGVITVGTETLISTNTTQSLTDNYIAISPDGKVCLSWRGNTTTNYIVVCTVSGTVITVGTATTYTQASEGVGPQGVAWLNDNNIFWGVAYSDTNARAMIATIDSDLSITLGTATTISSSIGRFDLVALDSGTVVISQYRTTTTQTATPSFLGCSISGTTVSLLSGTGTADTSYYGCLSGYQNNLVRLQDGSAAAVFIGRESSGTTIVWSVRITVSGQNVSVSTSQKLFLFASSVNANTAKVFAGSGGPFLFVTDTNNYNWFGVLRYSLYGLSVKELSSISHHSTNSYGLAISGANGLAQVDGKFRALTNTIKPAEVEISGLTKTEATTSSAGEVYVLNN